MLTGKMVSLKIDSWEDRRQGYVSQHLPLDAMRHLSLVARIGSLNAKLTSTSGSVSPKMLGLLHMQAGRASRWIGRSPKVEKTQSTLWLCIL